MGLPNDFMVSVISSVGNYGEIYDRNLGSESQFNLRSGPQRPLDRGWLGLSPAVPLIAMLSS